MLNAFLIALREGFEAALIVGILVAYLVKTDRRSRLRPLWIGVASAIVASIVFGAILTSVDDKLGETGELVFVGGASILAAILVTGMIFWMKKTARSLKSELQGKLDNAIMAGPFAIAITAFLSVAREGLETVLFLYSSFKSSEEAPSAIVGLSLGLALAIVLGIAIYRGSLRLNLSKFFTITGVALIAVVTHVLMYGVHEVSELGWIPESKAMEYFIGGAYCLTTLYFYLRPSRKVEQREVARV